MKIKFTLLSLLALNLAIAQSHATSENITNEEAVVDNSTLKATIRDNLVTFKKGKGVDTLDVTYEEARVTAGQPHDNHFHYIDQDSSELKLNFRSGRDKSAPVASWFNEGSGGWKKMINAGGSFSSTPSELNFALKTTFKINGSEVKYGFYMAQGSNSAGINNWWIGSKSGFYKDEYGNTSMSIETINGSIYRITNTGDIGHNIFKITKED